MGVIIIIIILLAILVYIVSQWSQSGKNRVAVIVLGDMGHSPRMRNHVVSLSDHKLNVEFVGYLDSALPDTMWRAANINIHTLIAIPERITKLPRMLRYAVKFVFQSINLFCVLMLKLPKCKIILVQNPPAIPVLFIAIIICYARGSELCIDWHNYGYSIMKLQIGDNLLVKFAYHYEHILGRVANNSFCVTRAMQRDLAMNWGVVATPLYDKPNPAIFNGRVTIKQVTIIILII